jgi:hypothetical protein
MSILLSKKNIFNSQKGFSIFIGVAVAGTLLLVAFSLSKIIFRQLQNTYFSRESQYAIFAADAGIECALYWDSKIDPSRFATSSPGNIPISCGDYTMLTGDSINGTSTLTRIGGGGSVNPTSTFGFALDQGANPVPYCAIVTVTKRSDGTTYIKSRGYNTCSISNPRRVERGVEVTY